MSKHTGGSKLLEATRSALKPIEWKEEWKEQSLDLAYSASEGFQGVLTDWANSLDNKIVALFTLTAALAGLAPTLLEGPIEGFRLICLAVAYCAWVFVLYSCALAYRPTDVRAGPDPDRLYDPAWLTLDPKHFKLYRLQAMAKTSVQVQKQLNLKADRVINASIAAAIQVAALAVIALLDLL